MSADGFSQTASAARSRPTKRDQIASAAECRPTDRERTASAPDCRPTNQKKATSRPDLPPTRSAATRWQEIWSGKARAGPRRSGDRPADARPSGRGRRRLGGAGDRLRRGRQGLGGAGDRLRRGLQGFRDCGGARGSVSLSSTAFPVVRARGGPVPGASGEHRGIQGSKVLRPWPFKCPEKGAWHLLPGLHHVRKFFVSGNSAYQVRNCALLLRERPHVA